MTEPDNQRGPYSAKDIYGRTSWSATPPVINAQTSPMNEFNQASGSPLRKSLREIGEELQRNLANLPGGNQGVTVTYEQNARTQQLAQQPAAQMQPPKTLQEIGAELNQRLANLPGGNQGVTITYIPGKSNAPDMGGQFSKAAPDPVSPAPMAVAPTPTHQQSPMEKIAAELNQRLASLPGGNQGVAMSFVPNNRPVPGGPSM
jgi:hypothetical protein